MAKRAKFKATAGKVGKTVGKVAGKMPGVSTNPMTNLVIADIAMRGGGRFLRHAIETVVLGAKYDKTKAKDIVKGRSMAQTLVGTAVARVATRSVPGAILVGGGLLAKTLWDRAHANRDEVAAGEAQVSEQAAEGRASDAKV
ncbi:hypothetical protein ACOYW6_08520 [Parablastomonas sp. CN1-191]|uniref:hypothetical protein n=1 Tax=Parablastomonas sp. CN1-191 TaxID=3400908 RepID=UPI003BF837EB